MTIKTRKIFLFCGILAGLMIACLGQETRRDNSLGWVLLLGGIGFSAAGSIYLTVLFRQEPGAVTGGDQSAWRIAPGLLAGAVLAPMEYLFLAAILPRGYLMQGAGLALVGAGLALYLFTQRLISLWEAEKRQPGRDYPGKMQLVIFHGRDTGIGLLALGLSVGYSSISGLLLVLVLIIPWLLDWLRTKNNAHGTGLAI